MVRVSRWVCGLLGYILAPEFRARAFFDKWRNLQVAG